MAGLQAPLSAKPAGALEMKALDRSGGWKRSWSGIRQRPLRDLCCAGPRPSLACLSRESGRRWPPPPSKPVGGEERDRLIEADEIGAMVTYLASPLAAVTNGAAIRAEGGIVPTIA